MKKIVVSMCLAAGVVLVAQPAMAVNWYSAGSPLQASDNGTVRAFAYGAFANSNGTYARSSSYQRDNVRNGNKVFVNTDFQFKPWPFPAYYTTDNNEQTPRTDGWDSR